MLLKDCPVGSVVRLVSIDGNNPTNSWWAGWSGEVFEGDNSKIIRDNDGTVWDEGYAGTSYQFEVVSNPTRTLTLSGTTYTLTPYEAPKLVTIDDVVYAMTEVK